MTCECVFAGEGQTCRRGLLHFTPGRPVFRKHVVFNACTAVEWAGVDPGPLTRPPSIRTYTCADTHAPCLPPIRAPTFCPPAHQIETTSEAWFSSAQMLSSGSTTPPSDPVKPGSAPGACVCACVCACVLGALVSDAVFGLGAVGDKPKFDTHSGGWAAPCHPAVSSQVCPAHR